MPPKGVILPDFIAIFVVICTRAFMVFSSTNLGKSCDITKSWGYYLSSRFGITEDKMTTRLKMHSLSPKWVNGNYT